MRVSVAYVRVRKGQTTYVGAIVLMKYQGNGYQAEILQMSGKLCIVQRLF